METLDYTVQEQMLHKFESRYHHKDGLKHIHILPFVECFPQLVTYIEELMQSVVAFKPSLVTKHSKNSGDKLSSTMHQIIMLHFSTTSSELDLQSGSVPDFGAFCLLFLLLNITCIISSHLQNNYKFFSKRPSRLVIQW